MVLKNAEVDLAQLLKQGRVLREDIQDNSTQIIEDAYLESLYSQFRLTSEEGQRAISKEFELKKSLQEEFRKVVSDYLDVTRRKSPPRQNMPGVL